jgi:deazaflavin-dependent oxidoreductase (nitroreductase family)
MMNAFELLCQASDDERRRRLPGDELVTHPKWTITHAITANAPPEAVWPWIIQLGSGRAGWYAYDHIDNAGVPSARRIVPELQHLAVGDIMPWLPGAKDGFIVSEVIPERALVYVVPLQLGAERSAAASGASLPVAVRTSVALILEPMDRGRTRLIARSRISEDWLASQGAHATTAGKPKFFIERVYGLLAKMPWSLLMPVAGFGHYLMESRMLRGIKRRAEALPRATSGDRPLPLKEQIKTRIEHEVDTRSVGLAAALIRLTKGHVARLWRRQVLLLTTRGRKSGLERTVPLQFFPDGDDMIIVAANSGLPSPPGWYFNLTADPLARVEVGGRTLRVRAEELSAEEAAAFWPRVLQIAPDYARYPRRTSRRIPLIRLVPVGSGEGASP